jgi:hypothetical protein
MWLLLQLMTWSVEALLGQQQQQQAYQKARLASKLLAHEPLGYRTLVHHPVDPAQHQPPACQCILA